MGWGRRDKHLLYLTTWNKQLDHCLFLCFQLISKILYIYRVYMLYVHCEMAKANIHGMLNEQWSLNTKKSMMHYYYSLSKYFPSLWTHLAHCFCHFVQQFWKCVFWVSLVVLSWLPPYLNQFRAFYLSLLFWFQERARSCMVPGLVNNMDEYTPCFLWACLSVIWHLVLTFTVLFGHISSHTKENCFRKWQGWS